MISGYLITGILFKEVSTDRFSIFGFYERRMKRILPALYAMVAVISVICWFLLMPVDYKEYGESLAGVGLFISNFYFFIKSGYFETSSEFRPLLHTWSLGVEEQFYIVFPLLLWLLARLRLLHRAVPILAVLWLVSLLSNEFGSVNGRFYLPWFRAWELLTGSLIAILLRGEGIRLPATARQILGAAAVLMIIAPIFLYTPETPFPGLTALPPVLGAALLIKLGEGTPNSLPLGSRALALRPVVYIGKISYSLYLWHWPPLVFLRYGSPAEPSPMAELGAVVLAFGMAVLSYHYVEQPIRKAEGLSRRFVLASGTAACLIALVFGASARVFDGLPGRLPDQVAAISQTGLDINPDRNRCDSRFFETLENGRPCVGGAKGAVPTFAVVGDSFADAMTPAVLKAGETIGLAGYQITFGGCYPLLGVSGAGSKCGDYFQRAADFLAEHDEITHVVLIARWSSAYEASRFGLNAGSGHYITDAKHTGHSLDDTRGAVHDGLIRMIEAVGDKQIAIAAFIPEQAMNVPRSAGVARLFGRQTDLGISKTTFEVRQTHARASLSAVSKQTGAELVDVGRVMCNADSCPATREDGLPLYVDDNHVSRTTAVALAPLFLDFLARTPARVDAPATASQ
ncbi:acyltransferase family protein [Rhodobacter xanthinilyticus]|nr:acyltransferase family protein [Rhodobacter xanthinilyticus]